MSLLVDYTHEPLPEGRFIRLVSLYPSPRLESPLYIEITTHRLDEAPPYAALSYTWGDSSETVPIWCGRWVIRIRHNLRDALRRIRHPEHPRQLWIDAVCINQSSIPEKNHQIPLMGEIYRNAEGVLIWLGEEAEESKMAFQLLSLLPYFSSRGVHKSAGLTSGSNSEERKYPLSIHDIFLRDNRAWLALEKLLQRPWFTRVWILQEFALAKHATIICGSHSVLWGVLEHLLPKAQDELRGISGEKSNKIVAIQNRRIPSPFISVLIEAFDSMSSEPRDKIYALLGLVELPERMLDDFPGRIDYNIPVADLYANVTKWCMSRTPMLLAFLLELAGTAKSVKNLPSWAIDWSLTWRYHVPNLWSWRVDWKEDFVFLSNLEYDLYELPLAGVQFDTVDKVGSAPAWRFAYSTSTGVPFFEALQDWQNLVDEVVIGREDPIQTFFHTLLAYKLDEYEGQRLRQVGFHRLCDDLGLSKLSAECSTPQNLSEACKFLFDDLNAVFRGKKMCLTSSGRLCMCPERAEEGDILVGLEVLQTSSAVHNPWRNNACCVLRQKGAKFSLVGRCFVYGGVQENSPTEVFVLV